MRHAEAFHVLQAPIVDAFELVLGVRLGGVVVYGSGADGSYIPGFSDLDIAVFCEGPVAVADSLAIHRKLGPVDLSPFSYLQVKFVDLSAPSGPTLIPETFEVLTPGFVPGAPYLFDDESLVAEAHRWLQVLPGILRDDMHTWAVAVGSARRLRHVRLLTTRIKPAVRSLLASSAGVPPVEAFQANWEEMSLHLEAINAECAELLRKLRRLLPPVGEEDEMLAGETALELLWRLVGPGDLQKAGDTVS